MAQFKNWQAIKSRFSVLLNLLEESGLFVLRKGSIESYYLKSDQMASIGKPNAAAEEMDHISNICASKIKTYDDIIRCIRYASATEPICESEALKDILLAVVAPAHSRFKSNQTPLNFNILSKSILGEKATVFDIEVIDNKLTISIKSNILNVEGFPIKICKDGNVEQVISSSLKGSG